MLKDYKRIGVHRNGQDLLGLRSRAEQKARTWREGASQHGLKWESVFFSSAACLIFAPLSFEMLNMLSIYLGCAHLINLFYERKD